MSLIHAHSVDTLGYPCAVATSGFFVFVSHHHGGCVSGAQLGVFLGPQHNVVTACAWRLGFQGWLAVSPRQGVRFVSGSCSVSLRWWAHATSVRVPVGTARPGVRGRSSLHFRAISPSCTTRIPTKDCHMCFIGLEGRVPASKSAHATLSSVAEYLRQPGRRVQPRVRRIETACMPPATHSST